MAYTTIRELGRGGFGRVELVQDQNGRQWAKKVFDPVRELEPMRDQVRSRFAREASCQASLEHPNIAPIIEHDVEDEPPWFVMPLAEGTLDDEIQRAAGTLTEDLRKGLFDTLAGLEELHTKGYLHRDLKPENVLKFRDAEGNPFFAISDLGLVSRGPGEFTTLTDTGMRGGTVYYAAPELSRSFRRAVPQSDIYSFGAILHDVFAFGAGRIPYQRHTVRGPARDLIEGCTAVSARDRIQTVEEVREALYDLLSDEDLSQIALEEQARLDMLDGDQPLRLEDWDLLYDHLEASSRDSAALRRLVRALSKERIDELAESAPDIFAAFGDVFAELIYSEFFDFDYCDVLAGKARAFLSHADTGLHAKILIGLLELGVSHNRWYVERVFIRRAGPEISEALAKRMLFEASQRGMNFARRMEGLEASIPPAGRDDLHPTLRAAVAEGSA